MAFFGVFLFSGLLAAVLWTMLCMAVGGAALLIAGIVLLVLHRRGQKRWMRNAGIVCAVLGGLSLAGAAAVYVALRLASA